MSEFQTAAIETGVAASSPTILQKIIDTTRECVLIVDSEMRIANCNAPATLIFGRSGMQLEHRRLSEVIRDLDIHEAFRNALNQRVSSDVRLEMIDAERRRFDVHIAPLDLDGRPQAIGFFYDKTQIERLESVRQEFLSNISHELRTPLTSILAFVETLEDGAINDPENSLRFLSVIRRNAERMSSLIADILELSMIESGKVSIEKRPVRLSEMTAEIYTNLTVKAREYGIELINNIPPDTLVAADGIRLEQMLINLIDNAIKFNRRGGSVTVAWERLGSVNTISVTDTGEGIMPEHLGRIFERFYRIDRARSREIGGTGLGLAIVKHLTRLHGGEVSVRSVLSEGTTFRIELPAN
ncbi:MAG: PAS domain-containing protein [Pyrinomonadaceae bacterium]|nr:PAS domain-containing protein [Pyrinomonadaceae bacterium]MBP6212903.1 PAS domain-containing protein [Pyrinomonadaceae bacterium]